MQIITVTLTTDPEGNKVEIIGKGKDFGKSLQILKTQAFPWLAGCDKIENGYSRYEERKQLNHDL